MVRARLRLVLALCVAASTQGFLFVQASFAVNQEWIAETLCVNRDMPEMKCDGKCVLAERMGHGHDHEHDSAPPSVLELALSIRPLVSEAPRLVPPPATARAYGLGPLVADAAGAGADVFRPPRAV